jgi:hypothetical protein
MNDLLVIDGDMGKRVKHLAMAGLTPSEISVITGLAEDDLANNYSKELISLYELQGKAMEGLHGMLDNVVKALNDGENINRDGFNCIKLVAETTPAFRNVQAGVQIVLDPNNPAHRALVEQTLKR